MTIHRLKYNINFGISKLQSIEKSFKLTVKRGEQNFSVAFDNELEARLQLPFISRWLEDINKRRLPISKVKSELAKLYLEAEPVEDNLLRGESIGSSLKVGTLYSFIGIKDCPYAIIPFNVLCDLHEQTDDNAKAYHRSLVRVFNSDYNSRIKLNTYTFGRVEGVYDRQVEGVCLPLADKTFVKLHIKFYEELFDD